MSTLSQENESEECIRMLSELDEIYAGVLHFRDRSVFVPMHAPVRTMSNKSLSRRVDALVRAAIRKLEYVSRYLTTHH